MSEPTNTSTKAMAASEIPAWLLARLFVVELIASGMLRLYLSSIRNVPTAEEAAARLEAFRESGKCGATYMPEEMKAEAIAYLDAMLDRAAAGIREARVSCPSSTSVQ